MSDLENNNQESQAPERKKISLQEAIKQKMESKKSNQGTGRAGAAKPSASTPKMKSQQTKKQNNQRRRTGV